jgi:hypothetical protein
VGKCFIMPGFKSSADVAGQVHRMRMKLPERRFQSRVVEEGVMVMRVL